jgi:hypothetical protein
MLGNFALKICGARADWEMENFTEKEIVRIRKLVGETAQVVSVSIYASLQIYSQASRLEPSPAALTARWPLN